MEKIDYISLYFLTLISLYFMFNGYSIISKNKYTKQAVSIQRKTIANFLIFPAATVKNNSCYADTIVSK